VVPKEVEPMKNEVHERNNTSRYSEGKKGIKIFLIVLNIYKKYIIP